MEKDSKNLGDGLKPKKKKALILWSLCCSIIFALILGCFYYCLEHLNQLNHAQIQFEQRLQVFEQNEANTYSVMVKMASTLRSFTEKIENTKENMNMKDPELISKNTYDQISRLRRNVDQSGSTQRGDRSQVEVMERTIHSFRREMISLNDRLRHLLRYKDKNDLKGPPGSRGPPGKSGPPGIRGFDGRDGYHGARGEAGLQGPVGPAGPSGPTGKDGLNGMNGIPGIPGFKGQKGEKGFKGSLGQTGNNGIAGSRGEAGQPGREGATGEKGEPGVCPSCYYPTRRYMEMLDEMEAEKPAKASGVTYIKWGSSNCPSSSRIVYSGHIGMSKYEHEHGIFTGSNAVCMPTKPQRRRNKRQAYDETYSYFLQQNLPLLYKNLSVLYTDTTPSPGVNVTENADNQTATENTHSQSTPTQQTTTTSTQESTKRTILKPDTVAKKRKQTTTTSTQESTTRTILKPDTVAKKRKPTTTKRNPKTKTTQQSTTKNRKSSTSSQKPKPTTQKPTTTTPQKLRTTTTDKPSYVPNYANMVGTRKYISCAVCDIQEHSQQIMIPAGNTCPRGWTMQYQGYLMNYHHGTQTANIICVNDQGLGISPSSDAGIRRIVSKYLSHIVTDCATFPCPPLNHNELLKCVVCSK